MSFGKSKHSRVGNDPMREIDLMLLEDVMQRYKVKADTRVRRAQTAALLVVLAAFGAMFGHAVIQRERPVTASAGGTQQDVGISTRFDNRWFW